MEDAKKNRGCRLHHNLKQAIDALFCLFFLLFFLKVYYDFIVYNHLF